MKVAILQSNYLPWKGYFDIINMVDLFIFYDDVQYTKKDWRNRNRIKTRDGLQWLTIPCRSSRSQLICEVTLTDPHWQQKHWRTIDYHYSRARYFREYRPIFEDIFTGRTWRSLSQFNQHAIQLISRDILKSNTRFEDSRQYDLRGQKEERILDLLDRCRATHYLCGPSAQSYIEEDHFRDANIELVWMDYTGYPVYDQLHPPFDHGVSIIDLIFNEGPRAVDYMKSFFPTTQLNSDGYQSNSI